MSIASFVRITVLFSLIPTLYFAFFPGEIVLTTILTCYPVLIFTLIFASKKSNSSGYTWIVVRMFIVYSVIIFVRGLLSAGSYQDWITLLSGGTSLLLFLPFTLYLGCSNFAVKELLRSFILFTPLIFVLFFVTDSSGPFGFTKTLSPLYFFILLFPYLDMKIRTLIMILVPISFFSDITIRSNMINIVAAISIMITYFFRHSEWTLNLAKLMRYLLIFTPLLFALLGGFQVFNVFKVGDYVNSVSIVDGGGRSQELFVDSRTGIYRDVADQLVKENAILWGLGGAGKTETSLVYTRWGDFDVIYEEGRRGTESGMLNYVQYGGLIGGWLYFLLFVRASHLAIYKSNNWMMVMLGIFVMFKGAFSFIADPLPFSVSSIFIFASIGMCFNRKLRYLSDTEMKFFLLSINPRRSLLPVGLKRA